MNVRLTVLTILTIAALLIAAPRSRTVDTRVDFERGKLENVSILKTGILTPAPEKQRLMDTGDPYVWSAVVDKKGSIYLGTGTDGRVYKLSAQQDSSLFFDAKELLVCALALDANDYLYAATSPDGRVYKISPKGDSSVFFDPEDSYIWSLIFDSRGNLYVATGEDARIYQVTPKGISSVVMESEHTHIRCLAIDKNDILYAGSSGSGIVYRIAPGTSPFAVYDTEMEEVIGVAWCADGDLYAAASAEVQALLLVPHEEKTPRSPDDQNVNASSEVSLTPQTIAVEGGIPTQKVQTTLFRLRKDGFIKDLWQGKEERIQTIVMESDSTLLIGAANDGKLYRMNQHGDLSLVLKTEEPQITSLCPLPGHQTILTTANMGRCYRIGPGKAKQSFYESEPLDVGFVSTWGSLSIQGQEILGNASFYCRSGNTSEPDASWSQWEKMKMRDMEGQIISPASRFLQWKVEFAGQNVKPALLDKVTVSYLTQNFAPEIVDIIIHRPGDFFQPRTSNPSALNQEKNGIIYPQQLGEAEFKKGFRSIDWLFQDANFDGLKFDIYYSLKNSSHWKKMASALETNVFSWDSTHMPDGEYRIKLVATDAPSNPEQLAQVGEKISELFIIDNTGPDIHDIDIQMNGKECSFLVTDRWSVLANVYYSVNTDEWQLVYPTDGVLDSKNEQFKITIKDIKDGDVISIKATDATGNINVIHKNMGL